MKFKMSVNTLLYNFESFFYRSSESCLSSTLWISRKRIKTSDPCEI